MAQYIGYSSINANKPKTTNSPIGADGGVGGVRQPIVWGKKFTLVDEQLVVQDLINAFNIRKGTKVGQPQYGSSLWDFVFEPNIGSVQQQIQDEVRRIASLDPRLILNTIATYPQENGILIELELAVAPFNQAQLVSVFLNQQSGSAALQ